MNNPYVIDSNLDKKVRVSVLIPCALDKVWEYVGTADGYCRWFPARCEGKFASGQAVTKSWWWDQSDTSEHRILSLVPFNHIEYTWEVAEGGKVRYEVKKGDPTVVTIEATYPETSEGREAQLLDVAPWTFAILNLKSVASGGVDLRHHGPKGFEEPAFID